jgi:cyclic beta-1,2-glucan synthetase
LAYARLGDGGKATSILELLSPVERARTAQEVDRYKGEPYAIAADVYSLEGREGCCGWTWYTGSAAWLYRTWIEEVLGLQLRSGRLYVRPVLSASWEGFQFRYRSGGTVYNVQVFRGATDSWVELDGVRLAEFGIPIIDDGQQHHARVCFVEATPMGDEDLAPVVPDDDRGSRLETDAVESAE